MNIREVDARILTDHTAQSAQMGVPLQYRAQPKRASTGVTPCRSLHPRNRHGWAQWPSLVAMALAAMLVSLAGPAAAKPWKGAEIITHQTFKYGAFEARIRGGEGSGLITAFFLWKDGSELAGTEWQEQDFEIFGKDGRYQSQVMTPGDPRTEHVENRQLVTPAWDNYYTYRMEWTPDYLAFYVDGHLVRMETDPDEYGKLLDPSRAEPAQLRLSLWAGDFEWSGPFDESAVPGAAFVDFCQVYDYTPGAGANGSDFSPRWRDDFNSLNTSRWWFANWTFEFAVNDYVPQNAAAIGGKLVLALTDQSSSGQFPSFIPPNNPPLPPWEDPTGGFEPVDVPGRIEAEAPSSFLDTSPGNLAEVPECSETDLDVEVTGDVGGGCNVAYTQPGEYTEYLVNVLEGDDFEVVLRAAAGVDYDDNIVEVEIDGTAASGPLTVPNLGWQTYTNVTFNYPLTAGEHTIRVNYVTGFTNLNYLELSAAGEVSPPGVPVLPARIQAEDYDAFFDTAAGNEGHEDCDTGDVDSEFTSDPMGGGCHIAYTREGEWTEYALEVEYAATYLFVARAATAVDDVELHLELDGQPVGGPLSVPNQGWNGAAFTDLPAVSVPLEVGSHTLRVVFDTGWVNLNYVDIMAQEPPPPLCELEPVTYNASAMSASTGGSTADGWNIWSNGTLSVQHSFQGGDSVLTVIARGESAAGVAPHMVVRVGSAEVGNLYVEETNLTAFEFYYDAPEATQPIVITFDNDYYVNGQDRNLVINSVVVDECP